MKIGLITWFSYNNYGTKLQAYATYMYLKKLGYDVTLINFNPDKIIIKKIKAKPLNLIKYKLQKTYIKLKFYNGIKTKEIKNNKFIPDNVVLSTYIETEDEYITECNNYDLLLYGSDQIWNPNFYHKFYYGNYEQIKTKRISYSSSFGVDVVPNINDYLILKKFESISCREQTGVKIIKGILDRNVIKTVDPTLLFTDDEWNNMLRLKNSKKDNYILCYFLSDNKNHMQAINRFAKKKELCIKVLPCSNKQYLSKNIIVSDAGPKDFIEYIKNATYVITDSYHAMLFSIIYRKEFYIFEKFKSDNIYSQNSRINDFLDDVKLKDRLIKYDSCEINEKSKINYNLTKCIIDNNINISKEYIINSINQRKENCNE